MRIIGEIFLTFDFVDFSVFSFLYCIKLGYLARTSPIKTEKAVKSIK